MMSDRKWVANASRTNSAHDGASEPIEIHPIRGIHITETIPERCKHVVGNKHRLHKFNDIDAIYEIFCESSVVRKC